MGTLLPCTWALAASASTGGMTVWTTVVAVQSQQLDQATLERGQTMAVSTHNAVAVGEAAGQLLDVSLRSGCLLGALGERVKRQRPGTKAIGWRLYTIEPDDCTFTAHTYTHTYDPVL